MPFANFRMVQAWMTNYIGQLPYTLQSILPQASLDIIESRILQEFAEPEAQKANLAAALELVKTTPHREIADAIDAEIGNLKRTTN